MDLSTVGKSLENGDYNSLNGFIKDIRLIFKNSKDFNTNPMSRVLDMTHKLEDFFEKRIGSLIHSDNWQNKANENLKLAQKVENQEKIDRKRKCQLLKKTEKKDSLTHSDNWQNNAKKETKISSNGNLKLAQKVENQEEIGRKRKCQLVKKTEKEDYKEFKLPYGWKKVGKCRREKDPSLNCNWDFYVFSPDGQKFRSNVEIKNYLEKNPRVKCDLQVTSCSKTTVKSLTKLCETTLGNFELYL